MPSVLCLGCGRAIEFTPDETGQTFSCLGCGCEVLAEPQAEYEAARPPVRGIVGGPIAFDEPEPWYYSFLVTYANVVKLVAVAAAVLTLGACVVALVLVGTLTREPLAVAAGVLGLLDAAGDDVLVRRQPGGVLELPREVVGVEADDRGHLRQGRAGVEVFLDVLHHGAEPPPR
jgi:hypothetical protein